LGVMTFLVLFLGVLIWMTFRRPGRGKPSAGADLVHHLAEHIFWTCVTLTLLALLIIPFLAVIESPEPYKCDADRGFFALLSYLIYGPFMLVFGWRSEKRAGSLVMASLCALVLLLVTWKLATDPPPLPHCVDVDEHTSQHEVVGMSAF
jgi:peptidoglycan/LPS O-acetylase OafA/YrhL